MSVKLDKGPLTWFAGLSATYAAVNVTSNVSSSRIIDLGFSSVDAGTLVFPLTFVMRDLVHKVAGKELSRRVVVIAASLSALATFSFWVVGVLPPDMSVGPQEEFSQVLNITWRIAVGGVIAQLVSELLDTEIYDAWEKRFGGGFKQGRVIVSNAVSVPVDSIVFTVVAFAGVYTFPVLLSIASGNILLKYAITLVFSPLIKYVPNIKGLEVK